jgi:transcriptional regulator with XRE-family HTH domain
LERLSRNSSARANCNSLYVGIGLNTTGYGLIGAGFTPASLLQDMEESDLAGLLGISRQKIYQWMKKDDFKESELEQIANALNCTHKTTLTLNDTGETF